MPPSICVGCTAGVAALSCPANARKGLNMNITNANAQRALTGITAVTTDIVVMFTPRKRVHSPTLQTLLRCERARLQHPLPANTLHTRYPSQ
jgi:hypothetical protein